MAEWLKHVGGISDLLIILACYTGRSYDAVIEDQVETKMTQTMQINSFSKISKDASINNVIETIKYNM
jgi:hypothetical protein